MTTPTPSRAKIKLPVRACINPTDLLGLAFPHGGIDLGIVADIEFMPILRGTKYRGEDFGGEIVEGHEIRRDVLVGMVLRGYRKEIIQQLFRPDEVTLDETGIPFIQYPGSGNQAKRMTDDAVKVFLSPRSPQYHPGLLLHQASADIDPTARMQMSNKEEHFYVCQWTCTRNSAGRVYSQGAVKKIVAVL